MGQPPLPASKGILLARKVPPNKHKHVYLCPLVRFTSKLLSPLGGVYRLNLGFIASLVWVMINRCVKRALITFWPFLQPFMAVDL